jgi:hypothetical protein
MEIIEPEIPSFEVFSNEIKKIFPEGDLALTYQRFLWYLEYQDIGGKPLTWEFLIDKFKQHIDEWNMMYGPKLGTQYFPTKAYALRKNFYDFLGDKFYEREFVTSVGHGERNKYLFGDFTFDYLQTQLEEFKLKFSNETDPFPD